MSQENPFAGFESAQPVRSIEEKEPELEDRNPQYLHAIDYLKNHKTSENGLLELAEALEKLSPKTRIQLRSELLGGWQELTADSANGPAVTEALAAYQDAVLSKNMDARDAAFKRLKENVVTS